MRVLIKLRTKEITDNTVLFFGFGFDAIPRPGDYIRIGNMKTENEWRELYNTRIVDLIYSQDWQIKKVTWEFDSHGIYPILECSS